MSDDIFSTILAVIEVLEDLGVPYHVGGSFASSIHGLPRQTRDLDLMVDLNRAQVPAVVSRLSGAFYLDSESIERALTRAGHFNLIHLTTGFKIDIFQRGPGAFERIELARSAPQRLSADLPRDVMVKSAEDTLLRKLEWYRRGGEVSDRQWGDILGIVRTQGDRLDRLYLSDWAEELGVADLLERALQA